MVLSHISLSLSTGQKETVSEVHTNPFLKKDIGWIRDLCDLSFISPWGGKRGTCTRGQDIAASRTVIFLSYDWLAALNFLHS